MNCSRCGKLIGEHTMGTILPLCQCAWQQPQNTFYVQDQSAEIEALREQVAELTQDVTFWNTTFIEAREGYESQLDPRRISKRSPRRNQTVEGADMKPVAWWNKGESWEFISGSAKPPADFGDCLPLYTADQLRQAKVEVLREAAEKVYSANEAPWTVLERMADELKDRK